MATAESLDRAAALMDLLQSHRITAILSVATQLGLADLLFEGPRTSAQLAQQTDAHADSLRRLLKALVTIGICNDLEGDRYELTAMGKLLASRGEPSLRSWAIFEGDMLSRRWGALLDSIRSGKNAAELAGFNNSFELMGKNPADVSAFNDAMVAYTRTVIPRVLAAYDFSAIHTLMDVGGGYGQLLCAILQAYPSMHGIVFDLERCSEGADAELSAAGVRERARFVAGSFFESVPPGADALILKSIIHDWTDERSIVILTACRRALPKGGRLLLVERLMPDTLRLSADDRSVTLSDLNMLRGPGGRERTADEYRELLQRSGFDAVRALGAGRVSVLEAIAAG